MCSELQVQIPAPHELSEVASNASNPNSWEIEVRGSQVQSHYQPQSEFETGLERTRPGHLKRDGEGEGQGEEGREKKERKKKKTQLTSSCLLPHLFLVHFLSPSIW